MLIFNDEIQNFIECLHFSKIRFLLYCVKDKVNEIDKIGINFKKTLVA